VRTLIDIPDDLLAELDALASRNGRSRAAEVREAVRDHLHARTNNDWIRRGAGYWAGRTDIGDLVEDLRLPRDEARAGRRGG